MEAFRETVNLINVSEAMETAVSTALSFSSELTDSTAGGRHPDDKSARTDGAVSRVRRDQGTKLAVSDGNHQDGVETATMPRVQGMADLAGSNGANLDGHVSASDQVHNADVVNKEEAGVSYQGNPQN